VAFLPDPVAWTQAPEALRVIAAQGDRWHRGLAEVHWRVRGLIRLLLGQHDWGNMERGSFQEQRAW